MCTSCQKWYIYSALDMRGRCVDYLCKYFLYAAAHEKFTFVRSLLAAYGGFPHKPVTCGRTVPIKGLNLSGLAWEDHFFVGSVQPTVPSDCIQDQRRWPQVTSGFLMSLVVTAYRCITDRPQLAIKHQLKGRRSLQVTAGYCRSLKYTCNYLWLR